MLPFIFHFLLLTLAGEAAAFHSKSIPCQQDSVADSCPPFSSSLPFPFSAVPGCGHPSFQVNCSSHATITINHISFSILDFQPNTSIFILSPSPISSHECAPHFPNIPLRPINFSSSPFRVSNSYCSHLASLNSCTRPSSPNCTRCPFLCSLVGNPLNALVGGCGSVASEGDRMKSGICQDDVLGYLQRFLAGGFEVEYDQTSGPDEYFSGCTQCKNRNGYCGFNNTDPDRKFMCFGSTALNKPEMRKFVCSVFALVFVIVIFFLTVVAAVYRYKRLTPFDLDQTVSILQSSPYLLPHVFTYEELESSTSRFDPKRKIGNGGFGSVYLGLLPGGGVVAVKCLRNLNEGRKGGALSTRSFCNEILILSSLSHPNLVKLHGYCSDPRGLILVYDYVPNGTLADHLHHNKGSCPLTWQVRLEIALQTAVALEYLHFSVSPPVVHRDVTSSNIFIERDMKVKLGDFGLSRVLVCEADTTSSSSYTECVYTGPQGTPGYLDPEYHKCFLLTTKSDVYSFGVVLLELMTGKKAVDRNREKREVALVDLAVPRIQMGLIGQVIDSDLVDGGVLKDGVSDVAELAFRCVAADKDDRPDSREVVEELKRIRNLGRLFSARKMG